ncbi:MAG: acyltransferase [Bacteroidia bacterium]
MNEASHPGESRIFGLDLMRMLAICLVLHSHTAKFVASPAGTQTALHFFGMVGVELFFVLSGFLIGSILIRIVDSPEGLTPRSTLMFWIRRWLRTLPNYYLAFFAFVGVIIWVTKVNILHFPDYKRLLYFMENMTGPPPVLYTIAWSLAVEEWFYLCFPLVIFPFLLIPRKWRVYAVPLAGLVVVIFSLGLRAYSGWGPHGDWASVFRKLVPMRVDAIAMGVLAAWIARRFPELWQKWRWLALLIGLECWLGYSLTLSGTTCTVARRRLILHAPCS